MSQKQFWAMCAVLAVGTAVAGAQGHGGTPRPFPARMGFPGTGLFQGPMPVMFPEVQQELRLSAVQVQKLRSLDGSAGGPAVGREKGDSDLARVLSRHQIARLHQIRLQMDGAYAFSRPEVAAKLELSAAQRRKLEALASPRSVRGVMAGFGGISPDLDFRKRALSILSPQQQSVWAALIGKPFRLPAWSPRRGAAGKLPAE